MKPAEVSIQVESRSFDPSRIIKWRGHRSMDPTRLRGSSPWSPNPPSATLPFFKPKKSMYYEYNTTLSWIYGILVNEWPELIIL